MKIINKKKTILLVSLLFTLYSCGGDDTAISSGELEEIIDDTLERFVPDGYTKTWEDHFDGTEINTANWTVGSLRDPETGDIIPGADGDHLLKTKYSGITLNLFDKNWVFLIGIIFLSSMLPL